MTGNCTPSHYETPTSPDLAPPRPDTPGATSESTSPARPLPYGGEVELAPPGEHTEPTTSPQPDRASSTSCPGCLYGYTHHFNHPFHGPGDGV